MAKLKKFLMGFVHAGRGLTEGFLERNMKFHGVVTVLVIILGWILCLNIGEWIIILILIGMVWSAELINTSVEELSNLLRDNEKLSYIATQKARDVAAASVLVMAIVAAIVGLMIFVPKIVVLFG